MTTATPGGPLRRGADRPARRPHRLLPRRPPVELPCGARRSTGGWSAATTTCARCSPTRPTSARWATAPARRSSTAARSSTWRATSTGARVRCSPATCAARGCSRDPNASTCARSAPGWPTPCRGTSRSTSRSAFTTPLPLDVIAWLMDIAEAPNFRELYDTIVAAGASNLRGDPEVQRRGEEARAELFAFVTPLIERRRADPGRRPAEHAVQHRVRGRAAVRRRDPVVLLVPPGRRRGDDRPGAVEPAQAVVARPRAVGTARRAARPAQVGVRRGAALRPSGPRASAAASEPTSSSAASRCGRVSGWWCSWPRPTATPTCSTTPTAST